MQQLRDAGRDQGEAAAEAYVAAKALPVRAEKNSNHKEPTGKVIYDPGFMPENLFKTEGRKQKTEMGLNRLHSRSEENAEVDWR